MRKFTLSVLVLLVSVLLLTQSAFAQNILAVDRDGSADLGFTDCWPMYMAALDANGYTYTYFEVADLTGDGPDLMTMMDYDIIIWFCGEGWTGNQTMSDNDEMNLASYLDAGGTLFLSGQDYLWDRYPSAGALSAGDFPYDYLGVTSVAQDNWVVETPDLANASGVAGSLAEGFTFDVADIFTTTKDGLFIDEIAGTMGMDLFEITGPPPSGYTAVQFDASKGFKTVFTTLSFAGITDALVQADLMMDIVGFLYGGGGMMCENFDALTVGGLVADQLGDPWSTWSGTPGSSEDAPVSDTYSNSPDNSFTINDPGIDLVYMLDAAPISSGMWMYSHYMYVPTGFTGYFNVQTEPVAGVDWNLDLYFQDGGTGYFGSQNTDVFTYSQDTWFMVEIMYDLDGGMGYVYFDGVMIIEFENTMTIGGIDYWGWDAEGAPGAYYDDVCFGEYMPPEPCENFDALTVGGLVADQLGSPWNTWSGTSADDATVSDMYSNSPSNSFVVDAGSVDLIYEFGAAPISTGQWLYSHYIYVPTGYSGYFNVQTEPVPGVGWNLDLYFDDGGDGHFDGQSTETFTYMQDTWIFVQINYDLDAGLCEVLFDGVQILLFENDLTIGGIDYYGADTGGDPGAYYDDVCFGPGWELSLADCENFDALTVGGLVADQLGAPWNTWSGTSADDATVSDMYSNSPSNSFVVDAGTVDLIYEFDVAPIATGQWLYSHYIYVPTGYSGYFNVQTEPVPGVGWNLDLYFDDGGDGHFDGQSTETFTYAQDTWILVEIDYDLDAGFGQVLFDGVLMLEFANALTIGGIDYYGADTGGDPGAYYDDVCFGPGWVITGIEDGESFSEGNTTLFPNPATDRITISSNNIIDEVLIYNNMGQLVYSGQVNDDQIMVNTSTFVTGMYIVQVRSGQAVEVRKLIIE